LDASVPRKDFLRLAAVGIGTAAAGSLAAPRIARAVSPTPTGDDFAYVQFGVVAGLVIRDFYHRALSADGGWTHGERRRLKIARDSEKRQLLRLNALLGEDAIQSDDYEIVFPDGAFASRARILAQGKRLEKMVVGVFIDGVTNSTDPGTRELLGRLIAADSRHLAGLDELGQGTAASSGLPPAVLLEIASPELDKYLRLKSFPEDPSG
jgi:hypothetical protein